MLGKPCTVVRPWSFPRTPSDSPLLVARASDWLRLLSPSTSKRAACNTALLKRPSFVDHCSVVRRPASKRNRPAEEAAMTVFDDWSLASELISRFVSDSICASWVPCELSTSMPRRKFPAQTRACESIVNAETRLVVSVRLSCCPHAKKAFAENFSRSTGAR